MSRKSKGINAERELVHKFWANDWSAVRVAGSGSSHYPSPDIVACCRGRTLAIECKASKSNKYLEKEEVMQLLAYATRSGAEPWIAVRFDREEWRFLPLGLLKATEKHFAVSREWAKEKGLSFEQLILDKIKEEEMSTRVKSTNTAE